MTYALDVLTTAREDLIRMAAYHEREAASARASLSELDAAIALLSAPKAPPAPEAQPKDEPSPRVRLAAACAEAETDRTIADRVAIRSGLGIDAHRPVTGAWAHADLEAYHAALTAPPTWKPGDDAQGVAP